MFGVELHLFLQCTNLRHMSYCPQKNSNYTTNKAKRLLCVFQALSQASPYPDITFRTVGASREKVNMALPECIDIHGYLRILQNTFEIKFAIISYVVYNVRVF